MITITCLRSHIDNPLPPWTRGSSEFAAWPQGKISTGRRAGKQVFNWKTEKWDTQFYVSEAYEVTRDTFGNDKVEKYIFAGNQRVAMITTYRSQLNYFDGDTAHGVSYTYDPVSAAKRRIFLTPPFELTGQSRGRSSSFLRKRSKSGEMG